MSIPRRIVPLFLFAFAKLFAAEPPPDAVFVGGKVLTVDPQFAITEAFAVRDGRVAYADWLKGYGLLLILDHGGGRETWYFHLKNGSVSVAPTNHVVAGQQIGLTASSGNSHQVSWDAAYAVIKRQNDKLFKTSPEHAAVMITEAVVQNPSVFPDCGRYLGDLFAKPEAKPEASTSPAPSGTSRSERLGQ